MFRLTVRKQTSPHFLVIRKSAAIALAEYCNDTADSEKEKDHPKRVSFDRWQLFL